MLAMPVLDVARIVTRLCSNAIPFLPRGPFRRSTGSVNLVALQAASRSKNDCRLKRIPASFRLLMQQVNLGIIGGGTVGGGVFQAIQRNGALVSSRLGVKLHIARIAVRDLDKRRAVQMPRVLLTTDWSSVVNDPAINLIVELIGGTATAR